MKIRSILLIIILIVGPGVNSSAEVARYGDYPAYNTTFPSAITEDEDIEDDEEFNARKFIFDHIDDAHEWHILTTPDGHHVSLYLPVIVYSKTKGLNVFSSRHLAHGHSHRGFKIMDEGELEGRIVELDEEGMVNTDYLPFDLSVTKNVAAMLMASVLLLWIFISLARSYRKTGISTPKGKQGFLEPLILFIRDDIAKPNIGQGKHRRFLPYLLTVFFFILINNLLGLVPIIPGGANVTGDIAVTFTLAAFTMLITNLSGSKAYWQHIFNTPGVPWWLKAPVPIMPVIEMISIVVKPFSLMIRLFANIMAGHIILLSLVALIFIFRSLTMAPISILMGLFMNCLEILVAFIQAYVFTLLSALFIGLAVEEHH
ncbi:MAG: F0F1 ATP synthase subunit A [Bacteroidota bacterium]|nr:F0F1 ATP synthase subunit A [Bacteroidota bacterium]